MDESLQAQGEDTVTGSKSKLPVMVVLIILLIAGGIWMYTAKQGSTSPSTPSSTSSAPLNSGSEGSSVPSGERVVVQEEENLSVMQGDVRVFTLEASSFKYEPDFIGVKKGEKVKIILKSTDMMHDFNVDELDLSIPVTKSGSTNEVVFTPDRVGEFEFYCGVGDHRSKGQVGTLVVTE